jgi:hypothetical protein
VGGGVGVVVVGVGGGGGGGVVHSLRDRTTKWP